ncbi:hypothetical protein OHS70_38135 [Streptomyces sp. NBC_00390]|uniref:hypothetical protein n=1 Tax=Streptomyces sp. NBC_00390 TaxID=2975736 RepID=UPI002E23252F
MAVLVRAMTPDATIGPFATPPGPRTERHGRCRRQPYARHLEHAHGVHRFELECGWHIIGKWTKDVTAAEAAVLVRAFVDKALAAEGAPAEPDAG